MIRPRVVGPSVTVATTAQGRRQRHPATEDESAQAAAELLLAASDVTATGAEEEVGAVLLSDAAVDHQPKPESWSAGVEAGGSNPLMMTYYPSRHDSLSIFFRQVYYVASFRVRDLCDRLNLTRDVLVKVWTCVENVIMHNTDLLRDRCLDQMLLCCLYGVCKVALYRPLSFVEVIQVRVDGPFSVVRAPIVIRVGQELDPFYLHFVDVSNATTIEQRHLSKGPNQSRCTRLQPK